MIGYNKHFKKLSLGNCQYFLFIGAYWPYGDATLIIAAMGYVGFFLVKSAGKHGVALLGKLAMSMFIDEVRLISRLLHALLCSWLSQPIP